MERSILRVEDSTIFELMNLETVLISKNIEAIFNDNQVQLQTRRLAKEFAYRSNLDYDNPIHGNIYFLSIGKSVPMLDKVAATMKSLSFPAFVLDSVHILHGDFGTIKPTDILIAVSKSGHTKELNTTLEYLKSQDIKFWYMTMAKPDDEVVLDLVGTKDRCIFLPKCEEMDGMDRVPTVSPITFQIVLDSMAMYAAGTVRQMQKDDFLRNHPGGDIGKFLKQSLSK